MPHRLAAGWSRRFVVQHRKRLENLIDGHDASCARQLAQRGIGRYRRSVRGPGRQDRTLFSERKRSIRDHVARETELGRAVKQQLAAILPRIPAGAMGSGADIGAASV